MEKYKKQLTCSEQVDYLKMNKRVIYVDTSEDEAKEFLYTHNYINTISPFKQFFCEMNEKHLPKKDQNGNHVYARNVDFSEYIKKYKDERSQYSNLYASISMFESTFNAILSSEVSRFYELQNKQNIELFILNLSENVIHSEVLSFNKKQHMLKTIGHFCHEIEKYNSVFIFLDRLSLSELSTIYLSCDKKVGLYIFSEMQKRELTLGYKKKKDFDESLNRLIQIRNCIMHSNSLTILLEYYNVKEKSFRKSSDRKAYQKIVKELLKLKKDNYF